MISSYSLFSTSTQVKIIVFDKTGTLTIGKPEVVSAVLLSEFSMEVLCDMAISVEVFFYVGYCTYLDICKFCIVLLTFLELVQNILRNIKKSFNFSAEKFSFYFTKAKNFCLG